MTTRPPFRPMLTAGVLAALLSVALNAVLYWLANALGAWSTQVVNPMGDPIDLSAVAFLSAGPPIVAAALAWVLIRWVPRGRAVFVAISLLVLVLFLFPPTQLGAPVGMVVVLELMHLVVAVPTVGLILRASRRTAP
ncbi:MAG: hypothetical protein GVY27_09645 [Deinococcus-Thermus bacterium]|nr:hypothetical protein [Deinococcota bacterium]